MGDLPELPPDLRDRYLDRLGGWSGRVSAQGLEELQRKHLYAVPFHNLALLESGGRPYRVPSVVEAAQNNASGIGGTCHLTTPAFAALLLCLGFQAALVAGTIRRRGDHIMARVRVEEQDFFVDVGNGHPYLHPLVIGQERRWSAHGWTFAWRSDAAGHRLIRLVGDQERLVYSVDPQPRAWKDFEPTIRAHHEHLGFGPFLSSLRAVRMSPACIQVVRNGVYSRYSAGLVSQRPLSGRSQVIEVLQGRLGLEPGLVEGGVDGLLALNPGAMSPELPAPRVLLATQTIGRTQQVRELVRSIEQDRLCSGLAPDQVEVLVLDNQAGQDRNSLRLPDDLALSINVVPVQAHRDSVAEDLGLSPTLQPPLPIGAGRHALLRAVRACLEADSRPTIVWLVDDDMQLAQFQKGAEGLEIHSSRGLLAQVVELWRSRPELSVAIGTYTGDPPIPAFATWAGQLHDLAANLRALAEVGPEVAWSPPENDRGVADFYYDHAGGALTAGEGIFWLEGVDGRTGREVLARLAKSLSSMLAGSQVFRPLVTGGPPPSRTTSARGGNVLFLDADTLFAAPFPSLRCSDGVVTRRADSLAAALLERRRGDVRCEVVDLPLLHGRRPQDLSSPAASEDSTPEAVARFMESQARGIALGRSIADGRPVGEHLARRRALHRAGVVKTREGLDWALAALNSPGVWWHEDVVGLVCRDRIEGVLNQLAEGLPSQSVLAAAEVDVDEELEEFLELLPERAKRWEASWT